MARMSKTPLGAPVACLALVSVDCRLSDSRPVLADCRPSAFAYLLPVLIDCRLSAFALSSTCFDRLSPFYLRLSSALIRPIIALLKFET